MSSDSSDSDDSSADSAGSNGSARHDRACSLSQERWPPSFCCPITQEPMHDPVVAMDGHSYEANVISEWLRTHHTSPVNGDRLASKVLVRNVALRKAMSEWNELLGNQLNGTPEPQPEPEAEAAPTGLEAPTIRGPIVFEPQSEWEDLATTRRQRSVNAGSMGAEPRWLNRVCMLLMMVALGSSAYTYMYDPWDTFPPDPPPGPPPPFTCRGCISNGCCRPCPPPWEKHWFPPGAQSLQRQLFKWDKWEPTRLEVDMIGDARFTGCEFHNPLPWPDNKTKGNASRHSWERVNWIETRSAIQACDTEKKSSCVECVHNSKSPIRHTTSRLAAPGDAAMRSCSVQVPAAGRYRSTGGRHNGPATSVGQSACRCNILMYCATPQRTDKAELHD